MSQTQLSKREVWQQMNSCEQLLSGINLVRQIYHQLCILMTLMVDLADYYYLKLYKFLEKRIKMRTNDLIFNLSQHSDRVIMSSQPSLKKLIQNRQIKTIQQNNQIQLNQNQFKNENLYQENNLSSCSKVEHEQSGGDTSSYCYQHFLFDQATGLYSCKYCSHKFQQDRSKRLKMQLTRHLRYYHAMLEIPKKKHKKRLSPHQKYYEKSYKSLNQSRIQDRVSHINQIQLPCDLKVGSLKLNFGFGTSSSKLRWILINEMGLNHSEAAFYLQKYHKNQMHMAQNLNPQQKLIKVLISKKNKVVQSYVSNPIRQVLHKNLIIYQKKMYTNMRRYGQFIQIDVLYLQNSIEFKVIMIVWGNDLSSSKVCMGLMLFQSQIYSNFSQVLCEYLAQMTIFPEALYFNIPKQLFYNGWDPRPTFNELNTHLSFFNRQFIRYKFQISEQLRNNNLMKLSIFRRQKHFSGLYLMEFQESHMVYINELKHKAVQTTQKLIKKIYSREIKIQKASSIFEFGFLELYKKLGKNRPQIQEKGKEELQMEIIMSEEDLLRLSVVLKGKIFHCLLQQFYKALIKVRIINQSFQIKNGFIKIQILQSLEIDCQQAHWMHYRLENQCWYCDCDMIYKKGIPCCHLIKIIRHFHGSIYYYVNDRWLIEKNEDQIAINMWHCVRLFNQNIKKY